MLLPGVGLEGLGLQDEHPPRAKVVVDLPEESLDPGVSPVEVDPLGETEAQDDIVFWLDGGDRVFTLWEVVCLGGSTTIL